jgi:hypothetical protein
VDADHRPEVEAVRGQLGWLVRPGEALPLSSEEAQESETKHNFADLKKALKNDRRFVQIVRELPGKSKRGWKEALEG